MECGGESFLLQLSDVLTDYICSASSVTRQAQKRELFKQQPLQVASLVSHKHAKLKVLKESALKGSHGGV